MTKRETARKIAEHMNRINKEVNIERQTKILIAGMTTAELRKALNSYER